jgi:prophage antirepressor-like protein
MGKLMRWMTAIVLGEARKHSSAGPQIKTTLEDSIAYSSFMSSGVAGVEEISFEEFLRRARKRKPKTALFI